MKIPSKKNPNNVRFDYNEIIDKNGVHTNHYEIWEIRDNWTDPDSHNIRNNVKVKIGTIYYGRNVHLVVTALNYFVNKLNADLPKKSAIMMRGKT